MHLLDPEAIKERIGEYLAEIPQRRRLAFELSENVPVDLLPGNLLAIAEALREA